ncbi:hypothetical protein ABK040_014025 [Willaertia magna]
MNSNLSNNQREERVESNLEKYSDLNTNEKNDSGLVEAAQPLLNESGDANASTGTEWGLKKDTDLTSNEDTSAPTTSHL